MASPQKENGYTPIANELLDALAGIRISGEARQIFDLIIRKTYGFNKKQDQISLSQFFIVTKLKKQTVIKAVAKLKLMNLITVTQKGYGSTNSYSIVKDFNTWRPLPKKVTVTQLGYTVTQKGKKRNPKRLIQKTVTKETITKDMEAVKPPDEINLLLDYFKKNINPHINFGNKTERKASSDLIKTYGLKRVIDSITFLEKKRETDRYLPTITTPYELWTKWAKIKQQLQSKKTKVKTINLNNI